MSEIKSVSLPTNVFRVDIIESERGWGSKLDDTKFFDNELEARAFAQDFNSKNTEEEVPEWYMYATYVGKIL